MRRAGLSELSGTNMLVALLIMGLIFLSQTLIQLIEKVAELLSQAEAASPLGVSSHKPRLKSVIWSRKTNAYDA